MLVKSSSQSASVHNYNRNCDTVYIIEIKFCFHIPDISHCKSFHTVNLFTACFVSWSQSLKICHSGLDHGITVRQTLEKGLVVSTSATEKKRGEKKENEAGFYPSKPCFTISHRGQELFLWKKASVVHDLLLILFPPSVHFHYFPSSLTTISHIEIANCVTKPVTDVGCVWSSWGKIALEVIKHFPSFPERKIYNQV